MSESFPEMSESFPEMSEPFPKMSESFPKMSESFPKMNESFPKMNGSFPKTKRQIHITYKAGIFASSGGEKIAVIAFDRAEKKKDSTVGGVLFGGLFSILSPHTRRCFHRLAILDRSRSISRYSQISVTMRANAPYHSIYFGAPT